MSTTIVNVGHRTVELFNGFEGRFFVPGRGEPHKEERPYGQLVFEEEERERSQDVGWGDRFPRPWKVRDFVTRLVNTRDVQGAFGSLFDHGLFVAAGPEPTPEELAAANERYNAWLRFSLDEGKAEYQQSGQLRFVNGTAKLAATVLGEKVPWAETQEETQRIPCPNCTEFIPISMAVHRAMRDGTPCGAVIDEEKALRLKLIPAPVMADADPAPKGRKPASL